MLRVREDVVLVERQGLILVRQDTGFATFARGGSSRHELGTGGCHAVRCGGRVLKPPSDAARGKDRPPGQRHALDADVVRRQLRGGLADGGELLRLRRRERCCQRASQ